MSAEKPLFTVLFVGAVSTAHFLTVAEATQDLSKNAPHLIVLGSPPQFHGTFLAPRDLETQLITVFGLSLSIFYEKPISTALPHESYNVAHRLMESGNLISVGYMMRYLRIRQKAKQIINENNLTPMSISARYAYGEADLDTMQAIAFEHYEHVG
ncbi:hypothetical protein ABVK25_011790 [Lepraria finkii]|uniref:Uncharacterized protein n=1 Tax=Lepraria finkii TaxID=1340010 RepID=A0ABR4ALW0_9LECA